MHLSLSPRACFTPLTCVLCVFGSVILFLGWLFLDFFTVSTNLVMPFWLPVIVLAGLIALLVTGRWMSTILPLFLVILVLYMLSYLLLGIGALAFLPVSGRFVLALLVLSLVNGSVIHLTRTLKAENHKKREVNMNKRAIIRRLPTAA